MYKICNIYCIGFPPFSGMELLKPLELPKRREEQRCLLLCEPRACGKAPRVGAGGQGSHRDERLAAFGPAPDLEVGLGSITSGQRVNQSHLLDEASVTPSFQAGDRVHTGRLTPPPVGGPPSSTRRTLPPSPSTPPHLAAVCVLHHTL